MGSATAQKPSQLSTTSRIRMLICSQAHVTMAATSMAANVAVSRSTLFTPVQGDNSRFRLGLPPSSQFKMRPMMPNIIALIDSPIQLSRHSHQPALPLPRSRHIHHPAVFIQRHMEALFPLNAMQ
jgi:CHASE1-domain containing sensor protein